MRDQEVCGLAEERRLGTGIDPAELWRQWFEAGTKVWADVLQQGAGGSYADPQVLYRQWFEGAEAMRRQITGLPAADGGEDSCGPDPRELWRRWFDATVESWEKSAELGGEMLNMTPRYLEMLDQTRTNLMSAGSFPKDPLEFAVQWYNATSGPFSEFVQDVIEREEFLEQGSRWLQSYASFYKVFSRRSEEYLKSLQLPVRSDITRVAGLVVALEDKVDRLEKRLDRVEGKLDRLLTALENGPAQNGGSPEAPLEATDAARRKARELGVDLSQVEGTGLGGQITVDDVRRRGEAR